MGQNGDPSNVGSALGGHETTSAIRPLSG